MLPLLIAILIAGGSIALGTGLAADAAGAFDDEDFTLDYSRYVPDAYDDDDYDVDDYNESFSFSGDIIGSTEDVISHHSRRLARIERRLREQGL